MVWPQAGGECGELVRTYDWASTPLGAIDSWPQSLRSVVAMLLNSRHPMFLWWGPELIQIYNDGYAPSFGVGKHPRAMGQRGEDCWQEIWPLIWPQIDDVMKRGRASWNEDALVPIWRNGRIEEVYWTYGYSPVFDEAGNVGGTLVVCTETTSKVLTARRLHASRTLAQRVAAATSVTEVIDAMMLVVAEIPNDVPFALVYLVDPITSESRLANVVGVDEAQRAVVDEQSRTHLRDGEVFELGDGSAFVIALGASQGAKPIGYIVFGLSARLPFDQTYRDHLAQLVAHLDVTIARIESYRAQQATALERNNLLLQAPVATALMRGPTHVFELANDLYCKIVGRSHFIGKSYLEVFPELASTSLPRTLDRVYRDGERFSSGEMLVPLDRGTGAVEDCFFNFNLEPLRDGAGRVYGMMAVAVDITAQVVARRDAERSQREREALMRELQDANRAKDEFLAMLGHELRNPLSPIVTAIGLMKTRSEIPHELEVIERHIGHVTRLVDDLLDVAKITRGKITLRKEPIEIYGVISKSVDLARDLLEQKRHRLTINVATDGMRVEGDALRLAQVFGNLLTNAARYTTEGGAVTINAARDGNDIIVFVRDNGIGIAPDLLPHVFDLFAQGQQATDRRDGGLGLGLALVKNLVALHSGSVVARSAGANQGTEIEVRLPATSLPLRDRKSPTPQIASQTPTRVMIVDDNVDSAEMLQVMLESIGHDVRVAHDGPSALAVGESFHPQIALLDIGLPVMDGYEVARRIHASSWGSACRLIALTGYGQDRDRAASADAGFEVHLVKPVEIDQIVKLVSAC